METGLISMKFSEFDLDNGLHVIMSPDRNAPVAAVDLWYHVGSKNEERGRTGFAHLFEHMMFQGSAHVGKAEHMKYVEMAGGIFNGSTTWDRTNYFETVPSNQLDLALWLESDRMMSLEINLHNLNNQRAVVKEERRFRVDNRPYGTAWEKIFSLAFKMHPYHWPVVGYPEHLDAASVDDARLFFQKYYAPNNAVLSIAGGFQPSVARRLVEKYFGEIRSGPGIQLQAIADPPLQGRIREIVYDNVALPAVYLAFRVPALTSQDSPALNLAADILSRGKSSRLYRRLVYDKRIAQSVEAVQPDLEDAGVFMVNAVVSPGRMAEEVETEIRKELRRLADRFPEKSELEKVRNQAISGWVKELSRALGRADNLAHFHTFYGNTGMINTHLQRLLGVSQSEISEVAKKYLDTEDSVVVYYLPKKQEETVKA